MMKITVIGVGNMGSAIARGFISDKEGAFQVCISNRSVERLEALKAESAAFLVEPDFQRAIQFADLVVLAVKPWAMQSLLETVKFRPNQVLISVAAGISFAQLSKWVNGTVNLYRVIPNTAIALNKSMNIISSYQQKPEVDEAVLNLFNRFGASVLIPEEKMAAATSISSCGIAYLFKYIQAAMQAGVELGLTPTEAKTMAAQAAIGAGEIILSDKDSHPSVEIDKVTTPGGLTIKGVNELDKQGFSSAIIEAIKKSTVE